MTLTHETHTENQLEKCKELIRGLTGTCPVDYITQKVIAAGLSSSLVTPALESLMWEGSISRENSYTKQISEQSHHNIPFYEKEYIPPTQKLTKKINKTRPTSCVDTAIFMEIFEEPPGSLVLEVGCHDESADAACMMQESGFEVIGIDLREPDYIGELSRYIRGDFCDLPPDVICPLIGKVDSIFAISALEHFGLGAYQEGIVQLNYDIIAARQAWQLLKDGGTFYFSVPYGREHLIAYPHWRVYNSVALQERLVQDFKVEVYSFFMSANALVDGECRNRGQSVTLEEANRYSGNPPHVTVLMKLRKNYSPRISPDRR